MRNAGDLQPLASPGKMPKKEKTKGIPPGWDYNPSTWAQRLPIVVLALTGTAIAGYLSLFQYRVIDSVWEPFFGEGSKHILNSDLSSVLPIKDALLGALSYLADAIAGIIGGTRRWRKMPWIVVAFGIAVGPLGVVSIALVMSQPLVVHAWCTLCLASAVVSVMMIGPAMDEMLASLQYMKFEAARGERSLWKIFWGLDNEQQPKMQKQAG